MTLRLLFYLFSGVYFPAQFYQSTLNETSPQGNNILPMTLCSWSALKVKTKVITTTNQNKGMDITRNQ